MISNPSFDQSCLHIARYAQLEATTEPYDLLLEVIGNVAEVTQPVWFERYQCLELESRR